MLRAAKIILLCTTALVVPQTVQAGPIVAGIQAIGGWLTATFGATLGGIIGNIGASILLSAVSRALAGKPKQQRVLMDLLQPTSQPVYRFVYGKCWAPGTPAPVRVKGNILYGCFILNSRPSAGPFTLFLDKREVEATGDPYDFAGGGAVATNDPFAGGLCRYWIGRGDQVSPPDQILSEVPEIFEASDGWRGLTVIWMRLDSGANATMRERWPAAPPEVFVDGQWSLVRDPRAPDDPPAWSANQALCVLDALRENPLRPYDDRNLWLETFAWAADVADTGFPVKAGGSRPLDVNGVLAFSDGTELEDQVIPLADAGASRFTRVGGRLGIVPAVYVPPVMTITDVLGDQPMAFNRYRPASELATEVSATYTSPERQYEDASTPIYTLVGAQEEDGGVRRLVKYDLGMVTDNRQAQYVAAIFGRRTRMQRSVSAVFPSEAFNLMAGATATLDLPPPHTKRNGIYEVEEIHPGGDPVGRDGFAMRCAAVLRETSPAVYAWNPAMDEQDIAVGDFDPDIGLVQPPGAVTAVSDAGTVLISGDTSITRALFSFAPSPSSSVVGYEWNFQTVGGLWQSGGMIDREIVNGMGHVFGYLTPAVVGQDYAVRVSSVSVGGASEWVESNTVTGSAGTYLAPPPTPISAVGGGGEITVTFQAPNSGDYRSMDIFGSDVDDPGAASLLWGPIFGSANVTVTGIETGLGAAVTRYYFARSRDRNDSVSPFSASISATTT